LRGRAASNNPASRAGYAKRIAMFEGALELDPHSVEAQSWLASALAARVLDQLTDTADADIARAKELVEQALASAPRSTGAHFAKGAVLRAEQRFTDAIPEYEMVVASNPNAAIAISNLGQCKFFAGSIEEMIPAQEQAIRLSPRDPVIGIYYLRIGYAHLVQSRTEEAILWLEKARGTNPAHPAIRSNLAAAYALKGESDRAAAELAEARKLVADDRYSSIARLRAVGFWGVPKVRALFEATYFVGLRKAGVSEE
jgi:adenylate cyclase